MGIFERQLAIGAIIASASAAAAAYIVDNYLFPLIKSEDPILPLSWHPFDSGRTEILFQDQISCSEDVIIDHEKGIAIISSDSGRPKWNTVMGTMYDPSPRGTIHLYNYSLKGQPGGLRLVELIGIPQKADFHPLGINIFRAKGTNTTRLFVVNHQRHGSTIDLFDIDYERAQAVFVMSVSDGDNKILSPNAVAPVSYTTFYVTNDHRFIQRLHPWLSRQESSRGLPLSWVTIVEIGVSTKPKLSVAASGIPFANGIILTPTGKEVVVAATSASALLIYERDSQTNKLSLCSERIPLKFRPDNLTFDDDLDKTDKTAFTEDGKFLRGLICAGHPSPTQLYAMSRAPNEHKAPSWVIEVARVGDDNDPAPCSASVLGANSSFHLRTLYQSDGRHYPSSTTGAIDLKRKRLFISGLYARGLLDISWS